MLMQTLFANSTAFLMMAAGFCFIIFVHELGHFLAAKAVNIKVTQFALGFGTAIFSWRKGIGFRAGSTEKEYKARLEANPGDTSLGETEYRFNWVPLGGYVKMVGQEDLAPDAVSSDPRSFSAASGWARALVLSAGVVMNVIFGLLFFIIAFMAGVALPPAVVGQVQLDSPASQAYAVGHEKNDAFRGIRPGDKIEEVNDSPITDFSELAVRTALTAPGEAIQLGIRRDGHNDLLKFAIVPKESKESGLLALGIGSAVSTKIAADENLPPALVRAGVEPDMEVTAVNGRPITRFDEFESAVCAGRGRPVSVTFSRTKETSAATGKAEKSVTADIVAVPRLSRTDDGVINLAGLVPATAVRDVVKNSPAEAAGVKPGDLLVRIDSRHWPRLDTVPGMVHKAIGRPIDLVLLRDDRPQSVAVKPTPEGMLGIQMELAYRTNIIAEVLHNSPLAPLSLNDGSRIRTINDEPITSFADIHRVLTAAVEKTGLTLSAASEAANDPQKANLPVVTLAVEAQKNVVGYPTDRASFTLNSKQAADVLSTQWMLQPDVLVLFEQLRTPLAANNPWGATKLGFLKTHQFMLQTYVTIARLFQGTVKVQHLRGPVGIADEGTRIARQGTTYLLFFLGLISVNLAVMNFLPLPVLDGGQLVLLIIEKIKGSPVSIRAQEYAMYVAFAALGCLVLVTFVFDIKRFLERFM